MNFEFKLFQEYRNLKKMHELKEEFRKIYETSENPTEGMLSISEWLAKSSSVFTKSCQTIRNWFGEIISYFERRTTNGVVEGINNKLKLIKRRGYGFRNFQTIWSNKIHSLKYKKSTTSGCKYVRIWKWRVRREFNNFYFLKWSSCLKGKDNTRLGQV